MYETWIIDKLEGLISKWVMKYLSINKHGYAEVIKDFILENKKELIEILKLL
jgi:hypothetical protein